MSTDLEETRQFGFDRTVFARWRVRELIRAPYGHEPRPAHGDIHPGDTAAMSVISLGKGARAKGYASLLPESNGAKAIAAGRCCVVTKDGSVFTIARSLPLEELLMLKVGAKSKKRPRGFGVSREAIAQ